MLQAIRLSKAYLDRIIFEDVSFGLGKGERVGLIGPNGSGKSTLRPDKRLDLVRDVPDQPRTARTR